MHVGPSRQISVNIPLLSIIDTILVTWGLYAFFMVFAYSSDIPFPKFCYMFKQMGRFCLMLSLVTIVRKNNLEKGKRLRKHCLFQKYRHCTTKMK